MSIINSANSVSKTQNLDLGPTESIQLQYAKLQLLLSQQAKESAQSNMDLITQSQDEQKAINEYINSLRISQANCEKAQEEITAKQNEIDIVNAELAKLGFEGKTSAEIEAMSIEAQAKYNKLSEELSTLQSELVLAEEAANSSPEFVALQESLKTAQSALTEAQGKASTSQAELAALNKSLEEKKAELEAYDGSSTIESNNSQIKDLDAQIKALERQAQEEQDAMNAAQSEMDRLQKDIDTVDYYNKTQDALMGNKKITDANDLRDTKFYESVKAFFSANGLSLPSKDMTDEGKTGSQNALADYLSKTLNTFKEKLEKEAASGNYSDGRTRTSTQEKLYFIDSYFESLPLVLSSKKISDANDIVDTDYFRGIEAFLTAHGLTHPSEDLKKNWHNGTQYELMDQVNKTMSDYASECKKEYSTYESSYKTALNNKADYDSQIADLKKQKSDLEKSNSDVNTAKAAIEKELSDLEGDVSAKELEYNKILDSITTMIASVAEAQEGLQKLALTDPLLQKIVTLEQEMTNIETEMLSEQTIISNAAAAKTPAGELSKLELEMSAIKAKNPGLTDEIMKYLQDNNLVIPANDPPTTEDYEMIIESLENYSSQLGTNTQQLMVFINDFLGQYNSYLTGANSTISGSNQTLQKIISNM